MRTSLILKISTFLIMGLSLMGTTIVNEKDYNLKLVREVEVIRVGSIFKLEDGSYLENEESRLLAIKIANHMRKRLRERSIKTKVIVDNYFPEGCKLEGALMEKYKPTGVIHGDRFLYFLATIHNSSLENLGDFVFQGCPPLGLRWKVGQSTLPEVKRKNQECQRIDPEKLVKRNFCMAKIFIDYGVFE